MRKITKVTLLFFILGLLSFLIWAFRTFDYRLGIFSSFGTVFITLSAILAIYLVLTSAGENGVSYFNSMVIVGFLAGFIFEVVLFNIGPERAPLALTLVNKRYVLGLLFVVNTPSILAMLTYLFLSNKFPRGSKEVRYKLISIIALLVAYVLGSYVVFALSGRGYLFFAPLFTLFMLGYGFVLYFEEKLFLYANLLILTTTYIATRNIRGLQLRILCVLILILFMIATAGAPLILGYLS